MRTKSTKMASGDVLLVANDDFLPALLAVLDRATKSVDIIAYSFAIGSAQGRITRSGATFEIAEKLIALKKARKERIAIRLYIEGRRDTAERNRITAEYLNSHGIQIKYGSTHAKGFMIDHRYVLFGSTNLTNQSITRNNETNLLFEDPKVVKGFKKYFEYQWKGGRHGGVRLPLPLLADGDFKKALLAMISGARKRLEFSIYFFHFPEIEKALIRAHERGVKVRGFVHEHFSFALSYVRRTRGTVDRLEAAGLSDLHYGPNNLFTHSKYIIRDREEILLGTGNWLPEDVKVHPQLYVRLHNPKLAKELARLLQSQVGR